MRPATLFLVAAALSAAAAPARATELHVSPRGSDSHRGSRSAPLRTIQRAADLAQPGDVVTVHAGVYRERISPPRGGVSDQKRIVYRAAPGERVEIKGSEVVKGWKKLKGDVWKASVPNALFGSFNPFSDVVRGDWFDSRGREHHTGAVYLNGDWLIEAKSLDEVLGPRSSSDTLTRQSGEYLVNVAWLRPDRGEESAYRTPATAFAAKNGTQNAECAEGGDCIGFISHGHWVRYDGIDFGRRSDALEVRAASASDGGIVEVRNGAPDGELLGSCAVPNTGGWQNWSSFRAKLRPVSGVRSVCLVFRAPHPKSLDSGLWFASVDAATTRVWAQFPGSDPNRELVEINVRQSVFYPDRPNRDFITVRGFTMRHAATPWAPPTAKQIGVIGTHWSRGWVIEDNTVSHSTCSGIALGKYGDEWDNRSANSAEGYVETIHRALKNGWERGRIGHHVVRRNHISYCEQAGIVGSLGAAFSEVSDNTIHDVHVRKLFTGAEMAGIKFHGAIDTTIRNNHIYRTCLGLWLDWMAQGARISRNVLHDNGLDLFTEVNHGPFVVDNNLFLSRSSYLTVSRGGAFAHNLFAGSLNIVPYDGRQTPYHKPHSTEVVGLHDNPRGDDRYYNNVFVGAADLSQYDDAKLPVWMEGNVFLKGAKPSRHEKDPVVLPEADPLIRVLPIGTGLSLEGILAAGQSAKRRRPLVTTGLLGRAVVPNLPFESPDGSPLRLDRDLLGRHRSDTDPAPGPFEQLAPGRITIPVAVGVPPSAPRGPSSPK